jgi:ankyrin repeat protein
MLYDSVQDVLSRVQDVTEFLGVNLEDVNQTGIFGNTPLAVVITWGDLEAVSLLLEAGADVDARIEDGETAVHEAVRFDQPDIVKRLRAAKASVTMKNYEDRTPLDLARLLGNDVIVSLLSN